jgi:FixJ family two-component response regulator
MNAPAATVYLVDDDPSVLKALARLLRSAGLNVAAFASPQAFLEQHDPEAPGCLVLDVGMPELDGLQMQRALAAQGDAPPIVFLTGCGDIPTSVKAMKQGASDFLTKPVAEDELLAAVHTALEKDRILRQARAESQALQTRLAALTPREREVLSLVVAGKLNKQIAAELGTVEKTVKVHRAHLMQKLQVRSLPELVRLSEKAGISSAPDDAPISANADK